MVLKRCFKCGETKQRSEFYADRRQLDGCAGRCKLCDIGESKKWNKKNGDRYKANLERWRSTNPERQREYDREWAARNRDKAAAKARYYHALKQGLHENFTAEMATFVRRFWHDKCGICGKQHERGTSAFPLDHWQPLSEGHPLTMTNAVLMCKSCNSGKKNRRPSDIYSAGVVAKIERLLEKQSADWDAVQTIPQCGPLCAVNVKELRNA